MASSKLRELRIKKLTHFSLSMNSQNVQLNMVCDPNKFHPIVVKRIMKYIKNALMVYLFYRPKPSWWKYIYALYKTELVHSCKQLLIVLRCIHISHNHINKHKMEKAYYYNYRVITLQLHDQFSQKHSTKLNSNHNIHIHELYYTVTQVMTFELQVPKYHSPPP
jgi:hypothetical protein